MNQNVVRSVFTVFVFWWVVLAIYGLGWGDADWSFAWRSSTSLVVLAALGVGLGAASVWFMIWSNKQAQKSLLEGESVRGLKCTIGELPLIAREPDKADGLPDFSAVPDVPTGFFESWFTRYDKTHPAHAELMRVFLRIYEHHKALPATHVPGGHGGRTLLQHSLLAAYFMDKLAHSWAYTGLRDRTGKRVVLKLRDQSYKFNADDPLVALIGIAHDIGKIEAYIFDKADPTSIIGIHHEHDLTGARMIARLPEAWAIPDEDRQAMFLAIAHYHHPMELPLSPDRRAIDDRTIALMELLIKTDFVTSRVEAKGAEPTEREYEEAGKAAATTEVGGEALWNAFSEIITEHGRINSADPRFNVATLCTGKGFAKPMLMMKEDSIRSALVKRLHLQSGTLLGDGRYQLTIDLLKKLDEKGILVRSYEGVEFSPENALWNVDFMTRAAVGSKPEKKSGWSAVIVVDPKPFPRIEQMEPYWWFAVIQRGTMGAARAINKKGSISKKKGGPNLLDADDAELAQQLDQAKADFGAVLEPEQPPASGAAPVATAEPATEEPVAARQVAQPPAVSTQQEPKPAPAAGKVELEPLWDDGEAPVAAEATAGPGEDPPSTEEASAGVPTASDEPKRTIAPIDVKEGLLKAVAVASEQGVTLRQLNDRYLVSNQSLKTLVPEIDWDGCRYKIEQMSKGGKLDAMYVAMGETGDFALAFKKDLA